MKQGRVQWVLLFALLTAFGCGGGGGSGGGGSSSAGDTTTTAAIEGVTTVAFLDVDGPKVQAVVVKYDTELPGGSVGLDTYEVFNYINLPQVTNAGEENETSTTPATVAGIGSGTPGEPTKVYVSKTPDIGPGDDSGQYVIIELNTDYQLKASGSWRPKLAGGVKQAEAIDAGSVSAPSSDEVYGNYEPIVAVGRNGNTTTTQTVTDDDSYVLKGLEGYKIYTDEPALTVSSRIGGGAFKATHCFSEQTGEYSDVNLKYSLFVPEDYDAQVAADKKFALALHIGDGNITGSDPMIGLTETNVATNYAQMGQQLVKDVGLGGLIVVVVQLPGGGQPVNDAWISGPIPPAIWQLLDHLVDDTYKIDTDRIYGSGQSMGGMIVLSMAAHRDNYFAGIWSIGSMWANNYDKEKIEFKGNLSHTFPADSPFITNPEWENWYWSISDDNILVTNMTGDGFGSTLWVLLDEFYRNKAGVEIPRVEWSLAPETPKARQNEMLRELVSRGNRTGIYWNALTGGDHNATWINAHVITASYEWLLRQTRSSEEIRGKLDILKEEHDPDTGGGGTKCLDTGSASNGPNLTSKDEMDYPPQYAVSCTKPNQE
jgi:predicted peptidase